MANYHIHGLCHVRKLLTDDTARNVACSIAAILDYCNAVLYRAPETTVQGTMRSEQFMVVLQTHYMNNAVNLHIKKQQKKTYLRREKVPVRRTITKSTVNTTYLQRQ